MNSILSTVVGATLALAVIEADAQATPGERQVSLRIESTSLAAALDKWAQQSGFQIFVQDWEATKNFTAPSLKGTFSAQAALEQLLQDTPLTYVWINERAVSIRKKAPPTVPTALQRTGLEGQQQSLHIAKFSGDDVGGAPKAYSASEVGGGGSVPSSRIDRVEEVIVTGTHIRGVAPAGSALTVYNKEAIARTGAATTEQFIRTIPQNFALVDPTTSRIAGVGAETTQNRSFGSGVSIRGLGAGATLVLVNGHRLAPAGIDGGFADISLIPLSAIERVEVLTDGASAIYGADAVAGVVNFVLRDDFEGAETAVRYGGTSQGGADESSVSQLLGVAGDRGNVVLAYEYHDQDVLRADERGYVPLDPVAGLIGSYSLVPSQRRQSGFLTGRLAATDSFSLFSDLLYTERHYLVDTDSFGFLSRSIGDVTQLGGVLGGEFALAAGWRATADVNYSRTREKSEGFDAFSPIVLRNGNDSRVTSVNLRSDGRIFSMSGGDARASVGASFRREELEIDPTATAGRISGLNREVTSVYGEIFLPLVGADNRRALVDRLEVSLAVRSDDYDDFGSSTDPKIGVMWSLSPEFSVRGTYSASFKAPTLLAKSDAARLFTLFSVPDANEPDGITNTIVFLAGGNPDIRPEEAKAFTVGFDVKMQEWSLSATYFDIDFDDRISTPPLIGSFLDLYSSINEPVLSPFVDRSPDPAEIQRIVAEETFVNLGGPFFEGIDPALTEAIYDGRLHNISATRASGLELSARYDIDTAIGNLAFSLMGDTLFNIELQSTSATPFVDTVDRTYHPMDLRIRGDANWSRGPLTSSLAVNYASDYQNNLIIPFGRVGSWTTVDWQLTYDTGEAAAALLSNITLTVNVSNVADRDPPVVQGSEVGFDASNASPRGRFTSIQLRKRW